MRLFNPLDSMKYGRGFEGIHAHAGIDFAAYGGTPVFAAADGIVEASYFSQGHLTKEEGPPWSYGERIVLRHEDGSKTTYNHLNERIVFQGERVVAGQQIGEVGNTGYSFGAHLHFEYVDPSGSLVDPVPMLVLGAPPSFSSTQERSETKLGLIIVAGIGLALGLIALLVHKGA